MQIAAEGWNPIILIKYWLSVSQEEQMRRFKARINDPPRRWKLSSTDLESVRRWYEYSIARDTMFMTTDTDFAPWFIVKSDDKRRARLNCIRHLLSRIPYEELPHQPVDIPACDQTRKYQDAESLESRNFVPDHY